MTAIPSVTPALKVLHVSKDPSAAVDGILEEAGRRGR